MSDFLLKEEKIPALAIELGGVDPRDRSGEKIEEVLASVIPGATRLPKDKKWFDIKVNGGIGIESKTFQYDKLSPGSFIDNVLKRVSQVNPKEGDKLKPAKQVGRDLIDYLNTSIKEHAAEKGITNRKIVSVLARSLDNKHFAYWEAPLDFGAYTTYEWYWSGKGTLVGDKAGKHIFSWYQNQKQLFYRWEIPKNALFFEATPYDSFKITRAEYEKQIKESYLEGYKDKTASKKSKY